MFSSETPHAAVNYSMQQNARVHPLPLVQLRQLLTRRRQVRCMFMIVSLTRDVSYVGCVSSGWKGKALQNTSYVRPAHHALVFLRHVDSCSFLRLQRLCSLLAFAADVNQRKLLAVHAPSTTSLRFATALLFTLVFLRRCKQHPAYDLLVA
jgi:hypothetical protein